MSGKLEFISSLLINGHHRGISAALIMTMKNARMEG